jgi:hypothetical protein
MQRECIVQVGVTRATKLPSTDLLSKTDAYIKVKVSVHQYVKVAHQESTWHAPKGMYSSSNSTKQSDPVQPHKMSLPWSHETS